MARIHQLTRCLIAAACVAAPLILVGQSAGAAGSTVLTVPNPSFEQVNGAGQPSQWTVTGGTATVVPGQAHTGARSLEVVDTKASVTVRSGHISAVQNDRLKASAWIRGKTGQPAWLYLEYWTAGGTRIAERHVQPAFSTTWQRVSVALAAPPLTAYATVLVYGSETVTGDSYYDDVAVAAAPGETYRPALGRSDELLIDDYRVASAQNVRRVVHPGVKSPVLLKPDRPWEGKIAYLYGSVIHDSARGIYQMWYTAIDADSRQSIDYAESRDGVHWSKPDLGITDYGGSTANNIVLSGFGLSGGVVRDPADRDPARRYKMLTYQATAQGYHAYFSPDGTHWTPATDGPVITGADVANVSYDATRHRFLAMTKQPFGSRASFVSTSSDFVHWTTPQLALAADNEDRAIAADRGATDSQVYGMPAMAYGNAYIAFPWFFDITGAGDPGSAGDGTVQAQIAASRDLIHWGRPDRTPIVPVGPAGSWDDGMTFTASDLIPSNTAVTLYYSGWDGTHGTLDRGASIGRLTWRRDGFVSFHNGGADAGVLTTKPVTFTGSALHVNAELARQGTLRVRILDRDGNAIPGYGLSRAIKGNQLDATVQWGKGLGALAGRQVRFSFQLSGGDLYSFRVD